MKDDFVDDPPLWVYLVFFALLGLMTWYGQ